MRIPVTQADWPLAFNKIAKYIGRHWPAGSQHLNRSREITAVLFGYHSVHDTQQELLIELPEKVYSETAMIKSMILRALTKFHLRPDQVFPIFTKAPIRELAVYDLTEEAKIKAQKALEKSRGQYWIVDEYPYVANYKSPHFLIELFDDNDIPAFSYAVDQNGKIFEHRYLESFINYLDLNSQDLAELEFQGTPREFLQQWVIPMAWRPIGEAISRVNYRKEIEWTCPYMVEVENLCNGRFALYHKGVCGYYPASFDEIELKEALVAIYKANSVAESNVSNVEVGNKLGLKEGEWKFVPEPGTGAGLDLGERIEAYGQKFIRMRTIESYQPYLAKTWVKERVWPDTEDYVCRLTQNLLGDGIESDHERIKRWISDGGHMKNCIRYAEENNGLTEIFAFLFKGHYTDLDELKKRNQFCIERYEGMTEEDVKQAELEIEARILEAVETGARARKYHPEISDYFDNAALGAIYDDYDTHTNGCYVREIYFLLYVFRKQLSKLSLKSIKTSKDEELSILLLDDLLKGKLGLHELCDAWVSGCELLEIYDKQKKEIDDMIRYSEHINNHDERFVSHGPIAEITRKSSSEVMQEAMRKSRKYSMKAFSVSQQQI